MNYKEYEIKYIELKSGYSNNGPAWIGKVKISKSGNTIYFNNKAFQKHRGINSNYYDIESYDEYWISNVKKDASDRHWAGKGKIMIDKKIVDEYLSLINKKEIDKTKYQIISIEDNFPIDRINKLSNN